MASGSTRRALPPLDASGDSTAEDDPIAWTPTMSIRMAAGILGIIDGESSVAEGGFEP